MLIRWPVFHSFEGLIFYLHFRKSIRMEIKAMESHLQKCQVGTCAIPMLSKKWRFYFKLCSPSVFYREYLVAQFYHLDISWVNCSRNWHRHYLWQESTGSNHVNSFNRETIYRLGWTNLNSKSTSNTTRNCQFCGFRLFDCLFVSSILPKTSSHGYLQSLSNKNEHHRSWLPCLLYRYHH